MLAKYPFSATMLLVPTVVADGAAIVAALQEVASDTAALNNTVYWWDGGLFDAIDIVPQTTDLLHAINAATDTAQQSANLSPLEAISVAVATQSLIQDVNTTLTTIVDAKPKFDHLLLSHIVRFSLEQEQQATDEFSSAVAKKIPSDLVPAANALAVQIDASFNQALSAYGDSWWRK